MERALVNEAKEFAGLWGGFRASRVVLTANNLRMFENIGKGRASNDLAKALRADPRATEILLDAVASLGLLRKSGTTYRLASLAKRFLLPDSPWYQGEGSFDACYTPSSGGRVKGQKKE